MNLNPTGLSFFSETLLTTHASAGQKTLIEQQKQVDDFKTEWDAQASLLPLPSDRDLFAHEVNQLWQTLSATLATLSAAGRPHAEILQKMRHSLAIGRMQLISSLMHFKAQKDIFKEASTRFEQRAAASSERDFTPFTAPQRPIRTSSNAIRRLSEKEMTTRKKELVQCMQRTDALNCLEQHAVNLPQGQIRELEEEVLPAMGYSRSALPFLRGVYDAFHKIGLGLLSSEFVRKKHVLVLTSNSDENEGFSNIPQRRALKEINHLYNAAHVVVSDISSCCKAIAEETAKSGPLDILIIRAHGKPQQIQIGIDTDIIVGGDSLPCLRSLAPNATLVLDSCQTGEGREHASNIANYLARDMPSDFRVISPTEDITHFEILDVHPITVLFENDKETVPAYILNREDLEKKIIYRTAY